ncbi:MAG: nucleoside phosphorylase [Chitinophagales bacterium]
MNNNNNSLYKTNQLDNILYVGGNKDNIMRVIPESELILNPDGSIYHLKLRPEEVAPTIITVGDPERVEAITKHFDSVEVSKRNREFFTQTGLFKGQRITVVSTGIGTDNIDIVFNELDALFNIDFNTRQVKEELTSLHFIRIGTSGTYREEIPLDSFLVSEAAVGIDALMHFYDYHCAPEWRNFYMNFLNFWAVTRINVTPCLVECRSKLLEQLDDSFIKGITLTAPGFYAPQGRNLRVESKWSYLRDTIVPYEYDGKKFTNLEMETAGIYGLANAMGHTAISFNALIANRMTGKFSEDPGKTVDELIVKVLGLL